MSDQKPPDLWRRNLYIMWFVQVLTALGVSISFPFAPLFIQDLGDLDAKQAALWGGIASGAMGLSMVVFGPVWGVLGDRYGRKKNLLRAVFGAAITIGVTGLAVNVPQVVVFRFLTGVMAGIFGPCMALVAAGTPRNKMAYAIGVLQSALFIGSTIGPLVGGFLADRVNFQFTFFVSAGLLVVVGIVVLTLVREEFQRPRTGTSERHFSAFRAYWKMATSRSLLPILVSILLIHIPLSIMFPVLPVFVSTLSSGDKGGFTVGIAFGVTGLATAISSYGVGWLSQRIGLLRVMVISCVGAAFMYVPLVFVSSIPVVFLFLGLAGLFQGGLLSAVYAMVGVNLPKESHGSAYGTVQATTALAMVVGPLIGGVVATGFGLRAVFVVIFLILFLTSFALVPLVRRRPAVAMPVGDGLVAKGS